LGSVRFGNFIFLKTPFRSAKQAACLLFGAVRLVCRKASAISDYSIFKDHAGRQPPV
jgi:hypothetical protein